MNPSAGQAIQPKVQSRTDELINNISQQLLSLNSRLQPILSNSDTKEESPPRQVESTDLNNKLSDINEVLARFLERINI